MIERRVAKCNGVHCGAEIIWAKTTNGKNLCFDAEPSPEGEWLLEGDYPLRCVKMSGDTAAVYPGEKYVTHWATCPDSPQFRRKT